MADLTARIDPAQWDGVWPDNVEAMQAFLAISSQWRICGHPAGIYVVGLDYAAARSGFELADIEVGPQVWADLQLIEQGAKCAMNEG